MTKIIIAYVPGLHEGYLRFFTKRQDADFLYILGRSITKDFRPLVKDIRALDPGLIQKAIESWAIFSHIRILDYSNLESITSRSDIVVMPDEEECRELAKSKLSGINVRFEPVFLRWDKSQSISKDAPMA